MEHKGLVSRVAEKLERMIALGQVPGDGSLPSEQTLARRYGVSRTTVRGALQGLAARGLVVQHPGRRSRAVALDEALTLESMRLVLPEEGRADPDRKRLLEGFFALKREVTVELLAACCEHASQEELAVLEQACFALRDEVRWQEERRGWVQREFELLRLAARAADHPGHVLLVQSLEKAFWGMAEWVLPHLQGEALQQCAQCALYALAERQVQAVRGELSALLQAGDEGLLGSLIPAGEADARPEFSPVPVEEPLSGAACTNRYSCRTGLDQLPPTEEGPPQSVPTVSSPPSDRSAPTDSLAPLDQGELDDSHTCPERSPTSIPLVSVCTPPSGQPSPQSTLLTVLPSAPPLGAQPDVSRASNTSRPGSGDPFGGQCT